MSLVECFICGFKPQESVHFPENVEEDHSIELIQVKEASHVNFIFTKILDISSRKSRGQLKTKGGVGVRPKSLSLCQTCNSNVESIKMIYEELQEITKRLNEAKEKIQAILKTKTVKENYDSDVDRQLNILTKKSQRKRKTSPRKTSRPKVRNKKDPDVSMKQEDIDIDTEENDELTDGLILNETMNGGGQDVNPSPISEDDDDDDDDSDQRSKSNDNDRIKCSNCDKDFASQRSLKLHISVIHEGRYRFSCEECGKGFLHKMHLDNHLFRQHNIGDGGKQKLYPCPIEGCSKMLKTLSNFKAHVARHQGKPAPFQCAHCPSNFFNKSSLQNHEVLVHKLEPVRKNLPRCEKCGKHFAWKKGLEVHVKVCGKEAVKCYICDCAFFNDVDLYTHKKFKHPEVATSSEVVEELPKAENLRSDKPFQCSECGKTFSRQTLLRNHIQMIHQKQSKHNCEICGVPRWNRIELAKHLFKEHGIGEPPFQCESCGNTFWQMVHKKRHICNGVLPSPSDLKVSVCEMCGKEFKCSSKKRRHVMEFHKERTCDICGEKCNGVDTLKIHKFEMHAVTDYVCDYEGCFKFFLQKKLLVEHRKTDHGRN